jgi:hypothetical protein
LEIIGEKYGFKLTDPKNPWRSHGNDFEWQEKINSKDLGVVAIIRLISKESPLHKEPAWRKWFHYNQTLGKRVYGRNKLSSFEEGSKINEY